MLLLCYYYDVEMRMWWRCGVWQLAYRDYFAINATISTKILLQKNNILLTYALNQKNKEIHTEHHHSIYRVRTSDGIQVRRE
jgi:hypothetical protein